MKSVRVQDYMATRLVTFHEKTNVVEAMDVFLNQRISGAPVVDASGKLVGVVSELDILQAIVTSVYNGADPGVARVSEIMTAEVESNAPDDDVVAVAREMLDNKRRRRPIVEDGVMKGQLTCRQILRAVTDMVDDAS